MEMIQMSGAAGAALALIGTKELHGGCQWATSSVYASGAPLTDFDYAVVMTEGDFDAGNWDVLLAGTDWANPAKFRDGELSGIDAAGNYVNALAKGGRLTLCHNVRGVYAIRYRAKGPGATVTIAGPAV